MSQAPYATEGETKEFWETLRAHVEAASRVNRVHINTACIDYAEGMGWTVEAHIKNRWADVGVIARDQEGRTVYVAEDGYSHIVTALVSN